MLCSRGARSVVYRSVSLRSTDPLASIRNPRPATLERLSIRCPSDHADAGQVKLRSRQHERDISGAGAIAAAYDRSEAELSAAAALVCEPVGLEAPTRLGTESFQTPRWRGLDSNLSCQAVVLVWCRFFVPSEKPFFR